MRFAAFSSHRQARQILETLGQFETVKDATNLPEVPVRKGCSRNIKGRFIDRLRLAGWASPVKIDPSLGPDLNLWHPDGVVCHVQVGNVARAFYDLMKMQSLFAQGRARCGVLVMPTREAATIIGGNLANLSRVQEELSELFTEQITMPILLIGFG